MNNLSVSFLASEALPTAWYPSAVRYDERRTSDNWAEEYLRGVTLLVNFVCCVFRPSFKHRQKQAWKEHGPNPHKFCLGRQNHIMKA